MEGEVMLKRIANWLCPLVPIGESSPFGLSRRTHGRERGPLILRLPFLFYVGRGYQPVTDQYGQGLWRIDLLLSVERWHGAIEIRACLPRIPVNVTYDPRQWTTWGR
jgi:hypothetical protein